MPESEAMVDRHVLAYLLNSLTDSAKEKLRKLLATGQSVLQQHHHPFITAYLQAYSLDTVLEVIIDCGTSRLSG